ncbi:hypothetical protein DTO96_100603 [Ephemeroptericola cinctiostellae]|uniref:Low temperature requirement protein A n=1 Tax=Ephemeroptericola cinctiostellae TaxID=2268024 RepID=A0A345D954_9BURK|nr:low temperature requirement protein A [Ephemeroptericola cinctiostellae]AXF84892.1 hypothetical protein DTO96_100603 [Ephemeroptericola cinctiostellae]
MSQSSELDSQEYEITPLELFFDLVFVFGISQLSHHLLAHLSWHSAAETLVMLLAILTVWSYTSWAATMTCAEQASTRGMMLAVMLLGLFLNASITWAFAESGWVFVVCLLGIHLGRTVWSIVSAQEAFYAEHFTRVLYWFAATAPLWVLGAMVDADSRLWWWAAAIMIDLVGTWLAHPFPTRRLQSVGKPFDASRMLERCRLFLIIALGETVLTTGTAIAASSMTLMTALTGAFALVGSIALWALMFLGRAHELSDQHQKQTDNPLLVSRKTVLTTMFLVAGLVAIAVANEIVIAHPHAAPSVALSTLLVGGSIVFLLTQAWYSHSVLSLDSKRHALGIAAMLAVGLLTLATPAYLSLILVCSTLVIFVVVEQLVTRHERSE